MIVRPQDAWTRRPEDPRTVWGWIFRRRFEVASFDRKALVLGVFAVGAVIGGIYLVQTFLARPFDPFSAVLIPFLVLARVWQWRHPAAQAHAALPTLTDGTDALPVALTIFDEGGKITGRDNGWVAFADGWLVYEGLRASFSLTKASVGPPTYLPTGISLGLADKRRVQIIVLFDPVQTSLPAHRNAEDDLQEAARLWLQGRIAEGESILPPRRDHPEVVVERLAFPPTYTLLCLFLAFVFNAWVGLAFAVLPLGAALGCLLWLVVGLARFRRDLASSIR